MIELGEVSVAEQLLLVESCGIGDGSIRAQAQPWVCDTSRVALRHNQAIEHHASTDRPALETRVRADVYWQLNTRLLSRLQLRGALFESPRVPPRLTLALH